MKNKSVITTSVAIAATVAILSLGTAATTSISSYAHGTGDGQATAGSPGTMMQGQMSGQGYMGRHMGGQGHMGSHMGGQGQMGNHMMGGQGHMGGNPAMTLDLSVDDVRKIIEGRMAMHGNDRLKVGNIEVVDDETIIAEIVTVDDSLVMKMEFDRKTGAHHPVN